MADNSVVHSTPNYLRVDTDVDSVERHGLNMSEQQDLYDLSQAREWLIGLANAHAESLNEAVSVLNSFLEGTDYQLDKLYDYDPDTYLPKRGTGLADHAGYDPDGGSE